MRRPKKEIQLTSYDELLGLEESPEKSMNQVVEIELEKLYPFKNHPFHVSDDEKMAETVESIKNYGVLNPALVRPRSEGGYELISGHRRKRGCELCGKTTMPVLVRNYTDDEAVIIMVDSNIQRENILPSEKAHGLKVGRTGMACCPFHSDKSPSMKLDERYYCFGCGATGDAVDLTAKLFGIGLREAAVKLAEDFGLNYDSRQKPSVRPRIREPTPEQKYQKGENHCYKVLTDYFHLLREWEKKYAPKQPDEEWNPLFAEALYKKNYIEYLLDILLYGSLEERKALVAEQRKEVLKLEQRIAELSADRTMHSRRNPKQLRAERER